MADGICKSKSEDQFFLHAPPCPGFALTKSKVCPQISHNLVHIHILSLFRTKIGGQSVYKFWINLYSNKHLVTKELDKSGTLLSVD